MLGINEIMVKTSLDIYLSKPFLLRSVDKYHYAILLNKSMRLGTETEPSTSRRERIKSVLEKWNICVTPQIIIMMISSWPDSSTFD